MFEDEALAGLVSAHGLHDVLGTALLDRGGAPIHFVLAHVALTLDPSFEALRWLSVVFALATVPLSYDLGRRLSGTVAGATAAVLVASSGLLGIYGSFGRMYALYAFAATLSVDLFVRACVLRTTRATVAAAAAAWLLPAVHPFGVFMLLAEGVVAVAIWRREPVRIGLAVTAIALATVPFVIADLRLAGRFSAGVSSRSGLVTPGEAVRVQARALGSFAGGREPLFVVFGALALLGLVILLRDRPALGAFFLLSLVAPLVVLVLGRTSADLSGHLDARQLIADLPIWIALVAVGTERVLRGLRPQLQVALFAALTAAALLAPTAVPDPRTAQSGRPRALAAPAAWLRRSVRPGDVLFPSSPVFLAALPETGAARSLPREQGSLVVRAVRRASLPVQSIFVAVPLENEPVDTTRLHALPFESHLFEHWLLIRAAGPFSTRPETLTATYRALAAAQTVVEGRTPQLRGYFRQSLAALCAALHSLGSRCPGAAARS